VKAIEQYARVSWDDNFKVSGSKMTTSKYLEVVNLHKNRVFNLYMMKTTY